MEMMRLCVCVELRAAQVGDDEVMCVWRVVGRHWLEMMRLCVCVEL